MDENVRGTTTAQTGWSITLRRILRAALTGSVLALSAFPVLLSTGAAAFPGGSTLMDPWSALAAAVRWPTEPAWDCVGLPRPTPTADDHRVSGTAACSGRACRWDLDDDRLDGEIELAADPTCPAADGERAISRPCHGSTIVLVAAGGRWVGTASTFAADDRLVILIGTGGVDGLVFVGHWRGDDASPGRVAGLVTLERSPMALLWPVLSP